MVYKIAEAQKSASSSTSNLKLMYSSIKLVGNPPTELVNFHALFRGTCPEANDVSSQNLQSPVRTLTHVPRTT